MATNTSEHLGLNLWEPDDQVLREEFNENWEKIDEETADIRTDLTEGLAATAEALARAKEEVSILVRLGSYTASNSTVNANFDLSQIDMSKYAELKLWVGGVTAMAGSLCLRFNNDSSTKYVDSLNQVVPQFSFCNLSSEAYPGDTTMDITNGGTRVFMRRVEMNYQNMNDGVGYSTYYGMYTGCGLSGVASIQVCGSQVLNAGIEMVLYGIKK